jgi:hypothetical protein
VGGKKTFVRARVQIPPPHDSKFKISEQYAQIKTSFKLRYAGIQAYKDTIGTLNINCLLFTHGFDSGEGRQQYNYRSVEIERKDLTRVEVPSKGALFTMFQDEQFSAGINPVGNINSSAKTPLVTISPSVDRLICQDITH